MSLICGESNGVREESTACGPAERKKRTPRARPGGVRASRRRALRVAARSAPRRPVWNSHFGRPLEVAKPNSLFDFHTVADGAAPCDHRSGIVPGRGRFATSRLDPRVPGRGAPRDRSFHPRFCRKHGLDVAQPLFQSELPGFERVLPGAGRPSRVPNLCGNQNFTARSC